MGKTQKCKLNNTAELKESVNSISNAVRIAHKIKDHWYFKNIKGEYQFSGVPNKFNNLFSTNKSKGYTEKGRVLIFVN